MAVWQGFRIDGVQRIFIPTIYFVLLYGTRVLFGIESSNALPVLLFSNVGVLLLGHNALAVTEGMTTLAKAGAQASAPMR